ncbi:MAG: hypothetical protein GY749_34545 [Desulfobacteraceae bacterium]|nr:hypothetical protein [Desulfobacteraceae bacterium]
MHNTNEIENIRQELQAVMAFLGAISSGMEQFLGRPAKGISFLAGKKLGTKHSQHARKTVDFLEAIEISKEILNKNGLLWKFEFWKKKGEADYIYYNDKGNKTVNLIFRDCMIRQTLARYGHPQQESLCKMMFGYFSGCMESVLNIESDINVIELNVIHCGPNACFKELVLKGGKL